MTKSYYYRVPEFRVNAVNFAHLGAEVDELLTEPLSELLGFTPEGLRYHILKKSVDSRRGKPELIYRLAFECSEQLTVPGISEIGAEEMADELRGFELDIPQVGIDAPQPIVVGSGPAGLFAAWILALAGAKPIVLERGKAVEDRALDVAKFIATRKLDESSNYMIGEGGAGTFSDGKLYTRNRDARGGWVLARLVEAGAATETLYLKRPHLGSDRLPGIVRNMRDAIIAAGGEFRFDSEVTEVVKREGLCAGVRLASGEILESPVVIIAVGLGGRGLTRKLISHAANEPKGFQIGCRIEHPQEIIDLRQYRIEPRPATLGAAEYNFVSPPVKNRLGVSTFCMCPGGEIIPATAFAEELSTNGMSSFARSGRFANSALVATPERALFATAGDAFDFLTALGRKCYEAGGGEYIFPAQDAEAFMRGAAELTSNETGALTGLRAFDLNTLLPKEIARAFNKALRVFDHKFPGFIANGKLVGIESYISSPVRFVRDEHGESSVGGLYFAGEGAGLAGGILSAAIDGIKIAEYVIGKINRRVI